MAYLILVWFSGWSYVCLLLWVSIATHDHLFLGVCFSNPSVSSLFDKEGEFETAFVVLTSKMMSSGDHVLDNHPLSSCHLIMKNQ